VADDTAKQADEAKKTEFSEGTSADDKSLAAIAERLAGTAQPEVDSMVANIAALVDAASDLSDLQDSLLAAYGDLDSNRLVELMSAAFALAELKGMAAVQGEVTGRPLAFSEAPAKPAQPAPPQPIHIHLSEGMVKVDNVVQVPPLGIPEVTVHNVVQVPEQPAPNVTVNAEVTPPAVQIINEVQPAGISKVEIVSMPDRETISTVARDGQGNITRTTQIETDRERK
jgi:hypothetical protein